MSYFHVSTPLEEDQIQFGHAWRDDDPDNPLAAAVRLGHGGTVVAYNLQEAVKLAATFIVAAVALQRLDADPDLKKIHPNDLDGVKQAAAMAVADVLKAAR